MTRSPRESIINRAWPWLEAGLGLLFPPRCLGCGRAGSFWCAACDAQVVLLTGPRCPSCGRPQPKRRLCRHCREQPLRLRARAYALYEGPLARALVSLKYRPHRPFADMLGGWLSELVSRQRWKPSLVVPVPLSPHRMRHRGYNQAALIARSLAGRLGVPWDEGALSRRHETGTQVGLDHEARWHNVACAFSAMEESVQGRHVLLVDDLLTTGATLSACADALRAADVGEVWGVAVAQAQ